MVEALTGEGGALPTGAMPKVGNLSEAGEKNLLEALTKETVTKNKTRKKEKDEKAEAEEMVPSTRKQETIEQREQVLQAATQSRKYSLSLAHLNYSGELVSGLKNFSTKMEKAYDNITKLMGEGCEDEERWTKILEVIESQMKWYQQAEADLVAMFFAISLQIYI